jgi:hypothetical protein
MTVMTSHAHGMELDTVAHGRPAGDLVAHRRGYAG